MVFRVQGTKFCSVVESDEEICRTSNPKCLGKKLMIIAASNIIVLTCFQVVGGHICNASSTSDLNPVFIAAGATLQLASATSQRTVAMDSEFFVCHKQTCLKPDEVAEVIM